MTTENQDGPNDKPDIEVTDRRTASGSKRSRKKAQRTPIGDTDTASETPAEDEGDVDSEDDAAQDLGSGIDPETARALFPQNVHDVLTGMLLVLTELAWQKIGLRASPVSGRVEKDFAQARIAIDTVAFIVDQLSPTTPPDHLREFKTLVANLKINFARHATQTTPDDGEGN